MIKLLPKNNCVTENSTKTGREIQKYLAPKKIKCISNIQLKITRHVKKNKKVTHHNEESQLTETNPEREKIIHSKTLK